MLWEHRKEAEYLWESGKVREGVMLELGFNPQ